MRPADAPRSGIRRHLRSGLTSSPARVSAGERKPTKPRNIPAENEAAMSVSNARLTTTATCICRGSRHCGGRGGGGSRRVHLRVAAVAGGDGVRGAGSGGKDLSRRSAGAFLLAGISPLFLQGGEERTPSSAPGASRPRERGGIPGSDGSTQINEQAASALPCTPFYGISSFEGGGDCGQAHDRSRAGVVAAPRTQLS